MSIKVSVFVATSLDGFIARKDGSIDWLTAANASVPDGEDFGYRDLIKTVDVVVMGRNTFEQVLTFGEWPYGEKRVVVLSSRSVGIPDGLTGTVSSSSEAPATLIGRLSRQGAKHLYVDGGITIQRFLAAGLVDELTITLIPVLLGEGRPLFGPTGRDVALVLAGTRAFECGFVQLRYRVGKAT